MTRDIAAAVITESKKASPKPFALTKLAFDTGTIRLNSTDRNLVVDLDGDGDQTFTGVGDLGRISPMAESPELQSTGVLMSLTGVAATYITLALTEDYQGRPVKIWQGFFDDSYLVVATPVLMFSGFINTMDIQLGEMAVVEISAEHRLVRWEEPNIRRYTNEDQQERFPGDLGLEFVNQVMEKELIWGRTGMR